MNIQIRQGVFETNSSSTHAISVSIFNNNKVPKTVEFRHDYEFGWEFVEYNDTYEKAAYFWIAVLSMYDDINDKEKLEEVKQYIINTLESVGVEEVVFQPYEYKTSEWNNCTYINIDGWIDHGYGLYDWVNDMLDDKDKFLGWLFNPNSMVMTGNDNSYEEVYYSDNADYKYYKGN